MLTDEENAAIGRLVTKIARRRKAMARLSAYYEGAQRVEYLGLAVPPELRRFETVLNIPRMAVDEVERRLDVRALQLPDEQAPSADLHRLWDANDLDEVVPLAIKDALLYGAGYMSVGGNPADPGMPLIRAEHAPDVAVETDIRSRAIRWALREYRDEYGRRQAATLYSPSEIVWLVKDGGRWVEEARAPHGLGRAPIVQLRNRPRTGEEYADGVSEMADVIGLTDAVARTITNMQVAAEANGIPQKYVVGVQPKDFVGRDGKPKTTWESYFTSVWAVTKDTAKMGTFTAASLDNFHNTVNHLFKWAAAVLGLPLRYAAQDTNQPATEGAIVADESRLIKNCERKQAVFGNALGNLMGMAYQASTGNVVDPVRVVVRWHDPATPTYAQRADATQKLAAGVPILSREGAWDELGWTPERMQIERERFAAQESDPLLADLAAKAANVGMIDGGDA